MSIESVIRKRMQERSAQFMQWRFRCLHETYRVLEDPYLRSKLTVILGEKAERLDIKKRL
jgi:hypothetical protein